MWVHDQSRIDWDTTGRIIERVMVDGLDPGRLDNLFVVGVDEVSWRKGHAYLTLVSSQSTARFVWGKEGKDTETLDCFFDELGPERSEAIEAVSMDMGAAFDKSARKPGHATKAVICYDPFHAVALATAALEKVRRAVWQELRQLPDKDAARRFKGARWALLKNPATSPTSSPPPYANSNAREANFGARMDSRRPYLPCSMPTWTRPTSGSCSTGSAPRHNAAA